MGLQDRPRGARTPELFFAGCRHATRMCQCLKIIALVHSYPGARPRAGRAPTAAPSDRNRRRRGASRRARRPPKTQRPDGFRAPGGSASAQVPQPYHLVGTGGGEARLVGTYGAPRPSPRREAFSSSWSFAPVHRFNGFWSACSATFIEYWPEKESSCLALSNVSSVNRSRPC